MPKVSFIGTRISEEERARVEALRHHSSGTFQTAHRLLRYVVAFEEVNPGARGPEAEEAFLGQMLDSRRRGFSTVETYLKTIDRFRIVPGNTEGAKAAIRRAEIRSALNRAAEGTPRRVPTTLPAKSIFRALVGVRPRDPGHREKGLEYRTLWYLTLCTGNRVQTVLRAHEFAYEEGRVRVRWGPRKCRPPSNALLDYPTDWSFPPPPDVRRRIGELKASSLNLGGGDTVASSLNRYFCHRLAEWRVTRVTVTTSMARRRMATILLEKMERGELTSVKYADLMDHEAEVGRRHYRMAMPVEELMF